MKRDLVMSRLATSRLARFGLRNSRTIVFAVLVALLSSGTAAAASYLVLSSTNTASTTTTLKSAVNGTVLSIQNTNSTGGTSARGLSITVPAGRAPIVVSSTSGKATNLNADKLDGIDSSGFVRGPAEAWHEVGAAGNAPFTCTPADVSQPCWGNFTGYGFNTAAYYKDPLGEVHIKGLVQVHWGSFANPACEKFAIFTLPAGYRPAAKEIVITLAGETNQLARLDILPDGQVTTCFPNIANSVFWFSLDGITFRGA